MKHLLILLFTACTLLTYAQVPEGYPANYAKAPRFKALIYYTQHAEEAHVQFAEQATTFFKKLNSGYYYRFFKIPIRETERIQCHYHA